MPEAWRPDFIIQEAPTISNEDQQWLQREFEEEEVLNTVKLCASDKAPGLVGLMAFLTSFYQSCWEFLKDDIVSTMHHFHSHQVFEKSFNATYVALIPKNGAVELRDYRPIRLISGVYKTIAKTLTERVKRVVDSLVNNHQMAFT